LTFIFSIFQDWHSTCSLERALHHDVTGRGITDRDAS
jgi:hypothetical protein